jgi:hypothetical protein
MVLYAAGFLLMAWALITLCPSLFDYRRNTLARMRIK